MTNKRWQTKHIIYLFGVTIYTQFSYFLPLFPSSQETPTRIMYLSPFSSFHVWCCSKDIKKRISCMTIWYRLAQLAIHNWLIYSFSRWIFKICSRLLSNSFTPIHLYLLISLTKLFTSATMAERILGFMLFLTLNFLISLRCSESTVPPQEGKLIFLEYYIKNPVFLISRTWVSKILIYFAFKFYIIVSSRILICMPRSS